MKKVFIHIGYPKTGTTTLQQEVFQHLGKNGKINYFGMFCNGTGDEARKNAFFDGVRHAIYLKDDDFDIVLPHLKRELLEIYKPSKVNVLSNEHFAQSMWSGRWPDLWAAPHRTAKRLARIFQNYEVNLIVGIRPQAALLRSFYVQQSVITEHANATKLDDSLGGYIKRCISPNKFEGEMYHYDRVIKSFQEAFPAAPCFLYDFSSFISDQEELIRRLLLFVGIDESNISDLFFPLGNRNRKKQQANGTSIQDWRPLHHWLSQSAMGPFLKNIVRRQKQIRMISDFFKKEKVIPLLTADQEFQIEEFFGKYSSDFLIGPYPKILPPLRGESDRE